MNSNVSKRWYQFFPWCLQEHKTFKHHSENIIITTSNSHPDWFSDIQIVHKCTTKTTWSSAVICLPARSSTFQTAFEGDRSEYWIFALFHALFFVSYTSSGRRQLWRLRRCDANGDGAHLQSVWTYASGGLWFSALRAFSMFWIEEPM